MLEKLSAVVDQALLDVFGQLQLQHLVKHTHILFLQVLTQVGEQQLLLPDSLLQLQHYVVNSVEFLDDGLMLARQLCDLIFE